MSDTNIRAEEVDDIVERWAAKISRDSTNTLEAILTRAENVCGALNELSKYRRGARTKLQEMAHISQSEMSKLEKIGKHAELFRSKAHNLPASMSSLYLLARLSEEEMRNAIKEDLRSFSRSELLACGSVTSASPKVGRLLTISVVTSLDAEKKHQLVTEIWSAVRVIAENHGVELAIPSASGDEASRTRRQEVQENQKEAA